MARGPGIDIHNFRVRLERAERQRYTPNTHSRICPSCGILLEPIAQITDLRTDERKLRLSCSGCGYQADLKVPA